MTTYFFRKMNMATLYEALPDGTTALKIKDIRNAELHYTLQATEQVKSLSQTKMDKREVNQCFTYSDTYF